MDLASPHLIAYFVSGATVLVEEAHNFDAIRRICANHRVTHVHTTPLFYQMITTQPGLSCSDFPWIKFFISTGAPLPAAVADGFHEKFGREINSVLWSGGSADLYLST
jgi:acyl-coenzyme A synthetase/AMP-(fatty) acid ligase